MARCCLVVALVACLSERAFSEDLNPRGKPEQDLVKVKDARYFVWQDSEGWHLRTASKATVKFIGSVSLTRGTFGRLRTVGLEKRGRYPDLWEVSPERDRIAFDIFTGGSFDGFDFDVRGKGATIEYELKISKESKAMPKRIFIGRDNVHPAEAKFSFPADLSQEAVSED